MTLPSTLQQVPGRKVIRYAETVLPTSYGDVRMLVYREALKADKEHVLMLFGQPEVVQENVLCRLHSECITSEVFGSLKCDCREQLEYAMGQMRDHGEGVLVYLRQEGRGIGLGNKIRAYALQSQGADTIEANHQLGFETDLRRYDIAAGMLHELGIKSVRLLTNNPEKISELQEYGIKVTERLPVEIAANAHSLSYLEVKRDKCGHLLDVKNMP